MAYLENYKLCHEALVCLRMLQNKYNGHQYNFEPKIITEVPYQNSLAYSRLQ